MKFGRTILGITSCMFLSSAAFGLDDVVVGRDGPDSQPQPPAETETTTTESMLQQVLEMFGIDVE